MWSLAERGKDKMKFKEEEEKKPINLHPSAPENYSYDRSHIVVLDRMLKQAMENFHRSEPWVGSQHEDGIKIGKIYALQDAIRALTDFYE